MLDILIWSVLPLSVTIISLLTVLLVCRKRIHVWNRLVGISIHDSAGSFKCGPVLRYWSSGDLVELMHPTAATKLM